MYLTTYDKQLKSAEASSKGFQGLILFLCCGQVAQICLVFIRYQVWLLVGSLGGLFSA